MVMTMIIITITTMMITIIVTTVITTKIMRITAMLTPFEKCHLKVFYYDTCLTIWLIRSCYPFNTLRPRQNGRHFPDDIFKCIFLSENVRISIDFLLKYVPKGPINNNPASVEIMAWRRPGDKQLYASFGFNELNFLCFIVTHTHVRTRALMCNNTINVDYSISCIQQ